MTTPHQQNESSTPEKSPSTPNKAVFVRLTLEQYQRVKGAAKLLGKSIPDILRAATFNDQIETPLFSGEDARRVLEELARIGNNVNQIARKVNTGCGGLHDKAVSEMIDTFGALSALLTAKRAVHQAPT